MHRKATIAPLVEVLNMMQTDGIELGSLGLGEAQAALLVRKLEEASVK